MKGKEDDEEEIVVVKVRVEENQDIVEVVVEEKGKGDK